MDMKKSPVLSNRGSLVREGGVEPPRPHGHTDLNRARLPIPPLAHVSYGVSPQATHKTIRTARGAVQLRECDLRYLVVVGVALGLRKSLRGVTSRPPWKLPYRKQSPRKQPQKPALRVPAQHAPD